MTRILHIALSIWLAILLVFGGTPKEFVHLFANHKDTVHCNQLRTDGLVIEDQHHHCSFLSFTLAPFVNDVQVFYFSGDKEAFPKQVAAAVQHLTSREVITSLLRGPPALA
ncbi:hypothetical protein [Polluticoccus soli]|uniref:hypothetical protein n=1 Tax=Polluticoccus soli TaxID=3034150 RepID=UPI0023E23732|nr:hypothetical protein [Flavipsychrobacter sp. JY13-12]